jgi:Tol biopolymer transport system component/formylglycine-generating enzyme required for sulfatase activity
MNADGSQVRQLTTGTFDDRIPSWSPDGEKIAYQSNDGGDYEIFVYTLGNGHIRQVTNNSCNDYNPVWSPDAEWFVFYSDCDGNREIYAVRTDGSDRRQLTQTSNAYNWFPNWSPDERQITFSSNRSGKYQIYVMSADGSGVTPIVQGCLGVFSPDGKWMVFAQYCTDLGRLYLIQSDGEGLRILDDQERNANPSWSPNGEKIVFQSDRSGNEEIWVMSLDGSHIEQLTFGPGRDSAPVWQPTKIEPQSTALSSSNAEQGAGATQISPVDGMARMYVPAGEFLMGSSNEDIDRMMEMCPNCAADTLRDQPPQHTVYLDAYWIDQTEVTNEQFARFVAATGYRTTAEQKDASYVQFPDHSGAFDYVEGAEWRHPFGPGSDIAEQGQAAVTQISWDDATAYCQWAGRRLPTEAEWEKAARGSDGRLFPWGDQRPDKQLLNFNYNADGPVEVGSFPDGASPYGLLDIAGNVWEWVNDFYSEAYYLVSPESNPLGPASGEGHPFRGGSWASEIDREMLNITSAFRMWNYAYIRSNVLGIRCAKDAP